MKVTALWDMTPCKLVDKLASLFYSDFTGLMYVIMFHVVLTSFASLHLCHYVLYSYFLCFFTFRLLALFRSRIVTIHEAAVSHSRSVALIGLLLIQVLSLGISFDFSPAWIILLPRIWRHTVFSETLTFIC